MVVLLIGLPPTAPNPCSVNSRPANATSTPTTPSTKTTALRIPGPLFGHVDDGGAGCVLLNRLDAVLRRRLRRRSR